MRPICLIDEIRRSYPHLGVALYAFEPGQPVTLELHGADGRILTFTAPTALLAAEKACPELFAAEPEPTPAPPAPVDPTTLFD